MTNVSQDFAPASLIRAIEANTIESFKTWSKWKKMELHQDVDGMRITTDIPFFIFNLVFPSENSLTEPGYLIDAAISRARSRWVLQRVRSRTGRHHHDRVSPRSHRSLARRVRAEHGRLGGRRRWSGRRTRCVVIRRAQVSSRRLPPPVRHRRRDHRCTALLRCAASLRCAAVAWRSAHRPSVRFRR